MKTEIKTSVFSSLGYQVLSLDSGIYVLRSGSQPEVETFVALLLVAFPLRPGMFLAKLFLQVVPDGVDVGDIIDVWKDLDARRLAESGIVPAEFEIGPLGPEAMAQHAFERPGGGVRYGAVLPSNDVVCFN